MRAFRVRKLAIDPEIAPMTDAEIVDLYNGILGFQHRLLAEWDKTVIEEPRGKSKSTITKRAINGSHAGTYTARRFNVSQATISRLAR